MLLPLRGQDDFRLEQAQMRAREVVGLVERLMDFMVYAFEYAPRRDLRWSVVVAQGIHESNWMRSPVSREFNNTAGVKNGPATGEPAHLYRSYADLRTGTRDHIDLLAVYAGVWVPDMVDPTRNTRVAKIVRDRLGGRMASDITDLNGIWAEGANYGQNVHRTWKRLFE